MVAALTKAVRDLAKVLAESVALQREHIERDHGMTVPKRPKGAEDAGATKAKGS